MNIRKSVPALLLACLIGLLALAPATAIAAAKEAADTATAPAPASKAKESQVTGKKSKKATPAATPAAAPAPTSKVEEGQDTGKKSKKAAPAAAPAPTSKVEENQDTDKKSKKAAPAAAPAPTSRVEENLDTVKTKLADVGKTLLQKANASVTPNINAKAVTNEGGAFVARYVAVDTGSLSTEVRESTGAGGKYVGVIRYMENHYECRANSKAEALKAPCNMVRSRRLTELIRYDGKWIF